MRNELPLHDATFDGIVTEDRTTTLYFTRTDGSGCAVELVQVRELQMNDFRQGNIVIIFEVTTGELLQTSADLAQLFPPPHPSAQEEYQRSYADFVRAIISQIESGSLAFVEMQPAYGADYSQSAKR